MLYTFFQQSISSSSSKRCKEKRLQHETKTLFAVVTVKLAPPSPTAIHRHSYNGNLPFSLYLSSTVVSIY